MGRSISKKPPYGYKRNKDLILEPDPDTAWVVKKIFEMMRDGHGRQAIAAELDRLEIATPSPKSTNWAPSTITSIIKNEVYLGHIIWGKITYSKRGGKYKKKKMTPDEWIRKDHAHDPIVSQELFEAANLAHSGRYRPSTKANKKLSNPFAGVLKCEVCGHTLVYRPRPNRPNDYINCSNPACKGIQRSCAIALVEERVITSLEGYVEDFEVEGQKNKIVDDTVISLREKAILKKQKELGELSGQKNNLHDLLEQKVYDVQTFMERQKYLVEKMSKLEDEIQVLQEEIEKEQMRNKNVVEFVPKVKLVIEAYKRTDDIEKKNRLLKSILEKATYLRKKEWTKKGQFEIQLYPKI
jgi:site-specific DNA recombinase